MEGPATRMGAKSAPELCRPRRGQWRWPRRGWVRGLLSSHHSCLQTTLVWGGSSGKGRERLLLCWEECAQLVAWRARTVPGSPEEILAAVPFSFGLCRVPPPARGSWLSVLGASLVSPSSSSLPRTCHSLVVVSVPALTLIL